MEGIKLPIKKRSVFKCSSAIILIPVSLFALCAVLIYGFIPFADLVTCHAGNAPFPSDDHKHELKRRTVVFDEFDQYQNLSHKYDDEWSNLLTPNGGFMIKFDEKHNRRHSFGISMFHQLHCLEIIRGVVQNLFEELDKAGVKTELRDEKHGGHAHGHESHFDNVHWLHCLDYLRQTILCSADDTIEPPKKQSNGEWVVDGMGERKCKDWEPLYEMSIESSKNPEKIVLE